ncbi:MAG: helix-turn-helix domain-containing protein [Anaerolineales bacterium]
MGSDYLTLKQAAELSGLHVKTLMRLVRTGKLEGYKANVGGVRRWYVSADSLSQYTDPFWGFLLDLPGPKLYLRRVNDEDPKADLGINPIRGEREQLSIRRLKRKRRAPPHP